MHKLLKISRMEFRRTVMNRVFVLLTICGPLLICAVAILPGMLTSSGAFRSAETATIAVAGADNSTLAIMEQLLLPDKITLVPSHGSIALLQDEIAEGTIDGYLNIPSGNAGEPIEFVSKNMTDFRISDHLQNAAGKALLTRRLARSGIQALDSDTILRPHPFEMAHLNKNRTTEKSPDFTMILTTALIFASLLYLTILFYGQVVGRSVLMEKTNKTVEILLSSVRPVDILFGKIFGNALASLWHRWRLRSFRRCCPIVAESPHGLSALPAHARKSLAPASASLGSIRKATRPLQPQIASPWQG